MTSTFETDIIRANQIISIEEQYKEAEYFYLRLFKLLFDWNHLTNTNLEKANYPGIDLYESEKKLGVQITALTTNSVSDVKKKVIETIEKFRSSSVSNYKNVKQFICFFTKDSQSIVEFKNKRTDLELEKKYKTKITVLSTSLIIGIYKEITSKSKRHKLEEYLRQEISSNFTSLHNVFLFEQIEDLINFSEIYFTKLENKIKDSIESQMTDLSFKEIHLIGAPSSGKTTLANAICLNIRETKSTYYLKLSNPEVQKNLKLIFDDLETIQYNHSLLVIDDIHSNPELYKIIRNKINTYDWIKVLYISRETPLIISMLNQIEVKPIYIGSATNQKEKITGIIHNYVTINSTLSVTRVGEFDKLITRFKNNLTYLSIALSTWKNNPHMYLDQISNQDLYEHYYHKYQLKDFQNETTFLFAFLGKMDIPFRRYKSGRNNIENLLNMGIIKRFKSSQYFEFHHQEYATIIYNAFDQYLEFKTEELTEWLELYLKEQTAQNLNVLEILTKLDTSLYHSLTETILNNTVVKSYFQENTSNYSKDFYRDEVLLILAKSLNKAHNLISKKEYFKIFSKRLMQRKLLLYCPRDFELYNYLNELNYFKQGERNIINTQKNKGSIYKITDLSLEISKKSYSDKLVHPLLNMYDFSDWFIKLNSLPAINQISKVLAEFNKADRSRKTLRGFVESLNIKTLAKKAKALTSDKIAIALSEILQVDQSLGTSMVSQLVETKEVKEGIINGLGKVGLSGYTKTMSDLKKIKPTYVAKRLKRDLESNHVIQLFNEEKSLGNIIARYKEIKKISESSTVFMSKFADMILDPNFAILIKSQSNVNHLLLFYELLKKPVYGLTNFDSSSITDLLENLIIDLDYEEAINNPSISNISSIRDKVDKSLNKELLIKILKKKRYTILEGLIGNLVRINKVKTINSLNEIPLSILLKSANHNDLGTHQICEVTSKIKSKTSNSKTVNCNKLFSDFLNNYLKIQIEKNRFSKLGTTEKLRTYSFAFSVDPVVCNNHLRLLIQRELQLRYNATQRVSALFQVLRRIYEKCDEELKSSIETFLTSNLERITTLIKNQELEKITSGLVELKRAELHEFADDLYQEIESDIMLKIKLRADDKIINQKIVHDLLVISKMTDLNEIKEKIASL